MTRRHGTMAPGGRRARPALTLDEAEAIFRDIEGAAALHALRAIAARNRAAQRPGPANTRHKPGGLARPLAPAQRPHARNTPPHGRPTAAPMLGLFWFVRDRHGRAQLLAHTCTFADAEAYGDHLGCPAGHDTTWAAWRRCRSKPPVLRARTGAMGGYADWPRGRIVFDCATQRFIIYADRQLLALHRLARITAHFHLPPARTVAHTDPHYRNTRSIGPR